MKYNLSKSKALVVAIGMIAITITNANARKSIYHKGIPCGNGWIAANKTCHEGEVYSGSGYGYGSIQTQSNSTAKTASSSSTTAPKARTYPRMFGCNDSSKVSVQSALTINAISNIFGRLISTPESNVRSGEIADSICDKFFLIPVESKFLYDQAAQEIVISPVIDTSFFEMPNSNQEKFLNLTTLKIGEISNQNAHISYAGKSFSHMQINEYRIGSFEDSSWINLNQIRITYPKNDAANLNHDLKCAVICELSAEFGSAVLSKISNSYLISRTSPFAIRQQYSNISRNVLGVNTRGYVIFDEKTRHVYAMNFTN